MKYGEIGCWMTTMTPATGFKELPARIFYFRPELVEICTEEKILCREHYYNIGAIVTVTNLHQNPELLDYLVSRTPDDRLNIQVAINLAYDMGTSLLVITANGYGDTGIVTDTYIDIVEPNASFMNSLMDMYLERVEGAAPFIMYTKQTGSNPYQTTRYFVETPYEYLVEVFGEHADDIVEHLKYEGDELKVYKYQRYQDLYIKFVLKRLRQYEAR